MDNINLPPFYIGQKVVAIKSSDVFKSGQEFVIAQVQKGCCLWLVDVGIKVPAGFNRAICVHCNHKDRIIPGEPLLIAAYCFAPIEENFETISFKEVIRKEKPLTCSN